MGRSSSVGSPCHDSQMSKELQRAQGLHRSIKDVLLNEWDPIGVAAIPEAQDEYDAYVPTIYRLLITHRPLHELTDFLLWAQTEHMALCADRGHTEAIAERLFGLAEEP
jgi:hypothetical protein